MLSQMLTATILLICMAIFFVVNIRNILSTRKTNGKTTKSHAEVEMPSGFIVNLAAFGTFMYFLEAWAFAVLVFAERFFWVNPVSLQLSDQAAIIAQIIGSIFTISGYFIFVWSVVARGRYATSWEMRDDHKLVTWGPYSHIRHPSYLGYFLMFLGLLIIWPSIPTLIPLLAVPGYILVTFQEEKLLQRRFGQEYAEYKKKTGRFLPKL